jgi:DNA-binding NarL/FixJ family response regulator
MIVDPSPIFRSTLIDVLQKHVSSISIEETDTGDKARNLLNDACIDVVFLEIALPGNNGIQLIATIKDIDPNTTIVVITSHDMAEYRDAAMRNGADYFLSKERSSGLRLLDVIRTTLPGPD